MSAIAASLPGNVAGLLQAVDLPQVRSSQAWVLTTMRDDGPALIRLLWRMLGREQDVLDAYQDCFCKLMAQFQRDGEVPSRGYVFRSAMNVALDARRRRKVRVDHLEAVAHMHVATARIETSRAESPSDLIDALRLAIAALPHRLREVVVLRDLAEMSYRDLGRVLGLTSGTARVYRREAIKELSARLSES